LARNPAVEAVQLKLSSFREDYDFLLPQLR